jgi:hypothetical protein
MPAAQRAIPAMWRPFTAFVRDGRLLEAARANTHACQILSVVAMVAIVATPLF